MSNLMNGKPYFGMRNRGTKRKMYVSSGLDYDSLSALVRQAIEAGLITKPIKSEPAIVKQALTTPSKKTYGSAVCVDCNSVFTKMGINSRVCLSCRETMLPCPICHTPFKKYRHNKVRVITCSSHCAIEYMRRGKKGKAPNRK